MSSTLQIVTDDGRKILVPVEDDVEIREALKDWRQTTPRSSKEVARFEALKDVADQYLQEAGITDTFTDHVEEL